MHASIKKPVKIVDYCDFPLQNVKINIFDLNKKSRFKSKKSKKS